MTPVERRAAIQRTTDILDQLQPIGLDAVATKHLWRFLRTYPSASEVHDFLSGLQAYLAPRKWTAQQVRGLVAAFTPLADDLTQRRVTIEVLQYIAGWILRFAEIPPNAANPATE